MRSVARRAVNFSADFALETTDIALEATDSS